MSRTPSQETVQYENEQTTAVSAPSRPDISTSRLNIIIAGLWLSLFVSAMDTTIITTALIKISSNFDALDQSAWLVTAYLLTYNAFLIIAAKLSDIWGLKTILLLCNIVFLVFSMACGGAQSMTQLIVFRAFQGIGGSGLYALVFVAVMKLITPEKLGFYSGIISSVFALANLLGPILGGVIADNTTWRWIFWINGPIVTIALIVLSLSMPGLPNNQSIKPRLSNFDIIGGILSVCWPIPLLFTLQEGGVHFPWNSAVTIGTLTAGLIALLIFGAYETWITLRTTKDAIFPIKFFTNPSMALLLLSMFLMGIPFYVSIFQLPQRFQAVNHTTASRAGILLLPLTLLTPIGAMLTGSIMGRPKLPAEYILLASTALISLGIGLLSTLPLGPNFWAGTYGYEVITGLGLGLASPVYYYLLYSSVEEKDVAVGTGALNMMRTLGGAVAVAICSALHHDVLRNKLPSFLTSGQIALIEESNSNTATLSSVEQKELGEVFGQSYNRQFLVMLGFCCANVLVAVGLVVVRKRAGVFGLARKTEEDNEVEVERKSLEQREHDAGEKGHISTSQ